MKRLMIVGFLAVVTIVLLMIPLVVMAKGGIEVPVCP